MVKYWPTKPSIYLNNSIVDLFIETEKKFILVKQNKSNQYLYIDILSSTSRNILFKHIISDLKKLILDLIEINLNPNKITQISDKIRDIFIKGIEAKFSNELKDKVIERKKTRKFNKNSKDMMDHLLIYLIFGSSSIKQNVFIFSPLYTPYNHIKILLENFIIEIANNVIEDIIMNLNYSSNINIFLKNKNICNKLYSSNRSIVLFLNNIKWQNFLLSYIYEVKSFYSERQQIWLLSSKGIITKYIHVSDIKKITRLNQFKVAFLIWLEAKDLAIPKTEKLLIQLAKYFLYSSLNLLSNIVLIIIKIIVFYLSK